MFYWMMTKSFLIGAAGACAVGPAFMLVVHRAVTKGVAHGIASAIATATVEGAYFTLALAGTLKFASNNPQLVQIFELVGGSLLLVMGANAFIAGSRMSEVNVASGGGLLWSGLSAAIITLSNPLAVLFYAGVSAKLFSENIIEAFNFRHFVFGGLSVAAGSFFTLSLVSFIASRAGNFLSTKFQRVVAIATGITFLIIASYLFASFILSVLRMP